MKPVATLVPNGAIFKYLSSLQLIGIRFNIMQVSNTDPYIIIIKESVIRGIQYSCNVEIQDSYTTRALNEDFELVSNSKFKKILKDK